MKNDSLILSDFEKLLSGNNIYLTMKNCSYFELFPLKLKIDLRNQII